MAGHAVAVGVVVDGAVGLAVGVALGVAAPACTGIAPQDARGSLAPMARRA